MVKVACIAFLLILLFVSSPTKASAQNPGKSVAQVEIKCKSRILWNRTLPS
jgi:hypothetical protein